MMLKEASNLYQVPERLVLHLITYCERRWVTSGEVEEKQEKTSKESRDDNMQAVWMCCAELTCKASGCGRQD